MSRELVIEIGPFGPCAGLMEDDQLLEVDWAGRPADDVRGGIFLGRVRALDRVLDAAFVDCGLDQDAWLSAREARFFASGARAMPITRLLHEGQVVLVQGTRAAEGGKGARITGDIGLVGLYLVLRPRRRDIGLSARLARTPAAGELRARAAALFPGGGVQLKDVARLASDQELLAEAARLREEWQAVEARGKKGRPPARLHGADDPLAQLLRDHLAPDLGRILLSDRAALARARTLLEAWRPGLAERLAHVPDAFDVSGAREQLEAALDPEVPLARGGSLRIEPTAALTAIDVDGGGRRALQTNLDAAREIARQLRLRRIGGTVVIDFVDLPNKRDREALAMELRSAFADDPASVQIYPMSPLGLVQLSRQRLAPTLAEIHARPCACCAGSGRLASLRRQSEILMRELERRRPIRTVVALADDLRQFLQGEGQGAWSAWLGRQGLAPQMQVDPTLGPGAYRIEEPLP